LSQVVAKAELRAGPRVCNALLQHGPVLGFDGVRLAETAKTLGIDFAARSVHAKPCFHCKCQFKRIKGRSATLHFCP
jgi:hypothetical protein